MNIEIAPKETETELTWNEAMFYCQFLNYNGGGWRLPTKEEFDWMYEIKTDDMQYETYYWSATEFMDCYVWVQTVELLSGKIYYDHSITHKDNSCWVRAIRDIL